MTARPRSTWLAVAVALMVLVLLGALDGVFDRRLGESSKDRSFQDVGVRLGGTAVVDGVRITVDRMESAYGLTSGAAGDELPTRGPGLYLVFTVRAERDRGEPVRTLTGDLTYAGLTTELRRLNVGPRPGTAQVGKGFVEVAPARLAESDEPVRLRLWHSELTYRYRKRVVVDLAMDRRRVDGLVGVPPNTVLDLGRTQTRGLP